MEETSMCPTPLIGDTSSNSRGFVLASLEEHPSEAQGKWVLKYIWSILQGWYCSPLILFSSPESMYRIYSGPCFSCGGRNTWQPEEKVWHKNIPQKWKCYLMLSTSLSAEIEGSHWAKPAFLLKLSSAFPLLQTCSCLLLHRKEKCGSNPGLGRLQCHGNHSIRPTEGFFLRLPENLQ